MGKLYTDWPNAEVAVETVLAELVPVMCKVPCDYLYRDDPAANVECSLLVQEYFDLDSMFCTTDVYNFEGEAMGAEIVFKKDHVPDFERSNPLIKSEKDLDKIKFTGLDAGHFPYLVEFVKQWTKYTGVETFPEISAPWTLAGNLYGMENLIMDTIEDPDFVKELLRRIVEDFHTPLYRAVHEVVSEFNTMLMGGAYASIPLVTMDIVDEFIRPTLERELSSLNLPDLRNSSERKRPITRRAIHSTGWSIPPTRGWSEYEVDREAGRYSACRCRRSADGRDDLCVECVVCSDPG